MSFTVTVMVFDNPLFTQIMGGAWGSMGGAWDEHGRSMGGAWEEYGRSMVGAWEDEDEAEFICYRKNLLFVDMKRGNKMRL